MSELSDFYIDGAWVRPHGDVLETVVNPSSEQVIASLLLGDATDVEHAVSAAKRAFPAFSATPVSERIDLLVRIIDAYERHSEALVEAVHLEMGAPLSLARSAHVPAGLGHFVQALEVLREYRFERPLGRSQVIREPIGVCALITPWNWPLNQLTCKLAPALAVGCTLVLKPSERAPLSAQILAQVLHEAGVPQGVFNMLHGDGPGVGAALARHADIDMVSFTGSTRAGVEVARAAAATVKRVSQELGGKSANILLDDVDWPGAVRHGVLACIRNSGQSCNAPTRLLVPRDRQEEVIGIARAVLAEVCFDDRTAATALGPVANEAQFERVQALMTQAMAEGSRLVAGGPGRPAGIERGYYVQPTIFADVTPAMSIAREEVFGPVLAIMPYDSEAEAISMANDSPYGLSGYVSSASVERACQVARQLRTGMVHINGARADQAAPFGGYKQSGNGREWGEYGFEEYLETKSVFGARQE